MQSVSKYSYNLEKCKIIFHSYTYIGQTLISNLYTITGHGSKGWTLSFGSCALLADLIDDTPTNVSIVFKNFMEQILFLDCYKYIFLKKHLIY